jgi:hypothetical protein
MRTEKILLKATPFTRSTNCFAMKPMPIVNPFNIIHTIMNFVQLIFINIYEESKGEIKDLFFIYK